MKRLYIGIQKGLFIGIIMSLIFSGIFGHGEYYPLYPGSFMGEIYYEHLTNFQVTLIAVVIWGGIGILFVFSNMIFSHTDLSLTAATIIHFFVITIALFILAILAGWFPLTVLGISIYVGAFIIVYLIIWDISRRKHQQIVSGINKKLQ